MYVGHQKSEIESFLISSFSSFIPSTYQRPSPCLFFFPVDFSSAQLRPLIRRVFAKLCSVCLSCYCQCLVWWGASTGRGHARLRGAAANTTLRPGHRLPGSQEHKGLWSAGTLALFLSYRMNQITQLQFLRKIRPIYGTDEIWCSFMGLDGTVGLLVEVWASLTVILIYTGILFLHFDKVQYK